ncbi:MULTISPECIES: hypothetical protein [Streptomyces]|uniref:hypothetical protein n=1 Tax=Streptomyces TaxID=1883 RepID=UPI000AAAEA50|nr:hypothetical protein [Streptomyces virginiae]
MTGRWTAPSDHDLINVAPATARDPLSPKAWWDSFDDHTIVHGTDPTTDDFHAEQSRLPHCWP